MIQLTLIIFTNRKNLYLCTACIGNEIWLPLNFKCDIFHRLCNYSTDEILVLSILFTRAITHISASTYQTINTKRDKR